MTARIYQRPKNAMQSGKARTDEWVLEFMPAEQRKADPLMGWAGSGDTQVQVQLKFPTLAAAQAYAAKKGIARDLYPDAAEDVEASGLRRQFPLKSAGQSRAASAALRRSTQPSRAFGLHK